MSARIMAQEISFAGWLKSRRRALDLTQRALADRVNCSVETIYKIEAGKRRPSAQIAELLSAALGIPDSEHEAFVQFARSTQTAQILDYRAEYAPWRTVFIPDNNLPVQLTSLVGREQQLAEARRYLKQDVVRLLTLLGPPGIGKTRMSIHLGEVVLLDFPNGVFFVELAPITNPEQIVPEIAQTLDILLTGRKTPLDNLKQYLHDRQMLLILDNLEQLLDAAQIVSAVLTTCPLIETVVTSRAPLRIRGEQQFPVEPLALPIRLSEVRVTRLTRYSAVQLFVERAQAMLPSFELTEENAASVAAICARLDGLPLAIEIVAARIKMLQPDEILERLSGRLLLQSEWLADVDPRHRTLSKAIGWSYDLLNDDEQTFFRRLGIFVDGCTLAAADAVAQPKNSVLDVGSALVDMNLVKRGTTGNDESRFTLLETIREYARHSLKVSGELDTIQQRHADYFYRCALEISPELHAGNQVAVLVRLEADHSNLLAALDYFHAQQDWPRALGLAGALFEFWVYRNHLLIGLRYAGDLLTATQTMPLQEARARLLNGASMLAYVAGDFPAVAHYSEQALAEAMAAASNTDMAFACLGLGMGNGGAGNYEVAATYLERGMESAQRAGEVWLIASLLNGFGEVARSQGHYEQALMHFEEALTLTNEIGYTWLAAHILDNIGLTAYSQGRYDRARDYFQRSLQASIDLSDERGIAVCIEKFAGLSAVEGQAELAARLLGAADALRARKNAPIEGMDEADYQQFVQLTREQLDDTTFAGAWNTGQRLPLSQVIDLLGSLGS
jgi:predicted ATPase/DNA-binding XRE family transcriptional regulator